MPYLAMQDYAKMYYEIHGEGQPIIFMHGWSGSTQHLKPIIDILKKDYQCICYDQRGHGASSRPTKGLTLPQLGRDLRELIEYLDLHDVILVGHSMGGATIYSYVQQFGCDRIKKAVVIDMSPKLLNDDEWKGGCVQGQYVYADLESDMELLGQNIADFMWRFYRIVLPAMAALPEALKDLVAPGLLGVNSEHVLTCLWHSMFVMDYRPIVKDITVPLLYMIPELGLYPQASPDFLKEHSSADVEVIPFPGITQMLPIEVPDKAAAAIKAFIEK